MSTNSSLPNPYDREHWDRLSTLEQTMLNSLHDMRDSEDKPMFTDDARSNLKETITKLTSKSQELHQIAVAASLDGATMLRLLPILLLGNSDEFMRQVTELMRNDLSMSDKSVDATKQTIQYGIEQGLLHAEAFTDLDHRAEVVKTAERMASGMGLRSILPNPTERSA